MYLYFKCAGQKLSCVMQSLVIVALLAFLMVGVSFAYAGDNFEEDYDDRDKSWAEIAPQLPPTPSTENLVPFYVSPTATQTFAIDANALSVGSDGVVRYTLVARSPSGAKSISYEGIRCAMWHKKLYAFGRADGAWSRSRRDQWEQISGNYANRQHAALAADYFCQGGMVAGNAAEIVERIRRVQPFAQQ